MKKIVKSIFILVIPLFLIQSNSLFASVTFEIQESSNAYWIDQGVEKTISTSSYIPYGSTIRYDMYVINQNTSIQSFISFIPKSGLSFFDYYPGVLKINGVSASSSQYYAFISNQGLNYQVSPTTTTFSIELKSIGSNKQMISGDLQITSPEVTLGRNPHICEHTFYGNFAFQESVAISFYDSNGQLLSTTNTPKNSTVTIPNVSLYGHTFKGFNTKPDGSGKTFNGVATSSLNLYAIFEAITFNVNYYIDDSLYKTITVVFGQDAENIIAPNRDGSNFLKWNKSLTNITSDTNVYAIYEDNLEQFSPIISEIQVSNINNGNSAIEKFKNYVIQYDKSVNQDKIIQESTITTEIKYSSLSFRDILLIILIVISLIFNITYLIKKKRT